ncbi:hypothetical protein JRQ81_011619 [Phrynocephalus forsythii]|uniref:Phospholipase A2 inhibitor and Ly6/PLAUR domain-containing protein-like n=1 Tax=Phrynocephalus forsythii TaxID=171643 RepID=A0A9Q1AQ83_9SAUR|nr:hypothetical protein JRQ81_011619 [Phrynocephalus forsythii]
MQVLLITCFLATHLSLGVSLECEECVGVGNNCNGHKKTCPLDRGSCAVIAMEVQGHKGIAKTCVPPSSCNVGFGVLNIGQVGVQKNLVSCCEGDECRRSAVTLPERNTTLNGRKCPGCYAFQKTCDEITVECAGNELFCFDMSGTSTVGSVVTSVVMKGCANEAACYNLENAESSIGPVNVIHTARCTDGAVPGHTSNVWELLCPTLSGLMLVMFLV